MGLIQWFRNMRKAAPSGGIQLRPNFGQGPYTPYFNNFVPRKVEPTFFEFLREAIPIVDAAINRLVSLDGHIEVRGDNENLVDEIKDWFFNVPVNDMQQGVQAWHQNITGEAFEQGFALGEYVCDRRRRDIVGLRTGDSKYIKFRRKASGLEILQRSDDDHEYRPLNPANLLYFSINNENQNPYGTPLMRSCEFVSQILVTIQNATKNVWERFGDPSFSIVYKTSKRDGSNHSERRQAIETEFATAIRAKRTGQSADFVRAIDSNSEINIQIIGADGQILEMEVPARHMLEQIVGKTGLPPWMLGLHWSTTERLSDAEASMLMADVTTRQAAKLPIFHNLVRTMLLLRGRKWKKKDWWLEWAGVNLHNVVNQAQARFLNAQADYYYLTNARDAGIEIELSDLAIGRKGAKVKAADSGHVPGGCKELQRAIAWPELDRVESDYESRLKSDWAELMALVKLILFKEVPKGAKDPDELPEVEAFTFSEEQRSQVMRAMEDWIGTYDLAAAESPVAWYYGQAYSLGLIQAARMVGQERPILDLIKNQEIFDELKRAGFELVKDNATRAIVGRILPEMEAFVVAGTNPAQAARHLEKLFGNKNADWERLARSEMAMSAEQAKKDEWGEWGVAELDFYPAPDACPICMALKGTYPIAECPLPVRDTHPRCRCSTRPAKSET